MTGRWREPQPDESEADPCRTIISSRIVVKSGGPQLPITAAKLDLLPEIIPRETEKLGRDGLSLAGGRGGLLEITRDLAQTSSKLCALKDRFGRTPLHIAAMKGRVEVMKVLLSACPDSAKEVTATDHETCIHTAVKHNKVKAVQYLVKWVGESTDYAHLINAADCSGNTAFHIATSRKQLQTLKILLTGKAVNRELDVNAVNYGGFTALDILHVLPYCGKVDLEIERILRRAGALRARDVKECEKPSQMSTTKAVFNARREFAYSVLLLMATMMATLTYQAVFSASWGTLKQGKVFKLDQSGTVQLKKQVSIATRSFILFNSAGFVASVAMMIFLLHEFPLKPWPQISVSTLFGSYTCAVMAISPVDALALLLLAIPLLLLASAGKLFGFAPERSM